MTNQIITKKLLLLFPQCETEKPIVYNLVRDYNLIINIFRAKVTPEEEGYLVIDVTGTEEDIRQGMEYVKTFDVTINETEKGVHWDEALCTHCGSCLTHCPTHALYIADRRSMRVSFDDEKCIECLNCLSVCPFGACSSLF